MKITMISASLVSGAGLKEDNISEEWKELLEPILYDIIYGNLQLDMTGEELILMIFGDDIRPPISRINIYAEYDNNSYRIGISNSDNSEAYLEKI